MSLFRLRYAAALLCILIPLAVPVASNAQRLLYSVDARKPEDHQVTVTIRPLEFQRDVVTLQMPAWAPGSYGTVHFGKFVKDVVAHDSKGKELSVKHTGDDRWEIKDASDLAEIKYTVKDSHTNDNAPYYALAQFDKEIVFANTPAIFGYLNDRKDIPATVNILVPMGWNLATPLDVASTGDMKITAANKYHQSIFTATTYDELVDAPILAAPKFETRSFKEGKTKYDIVLVSDRPFEMDSLQASTRDIVRSVGGFFHDVPFTNYSFLIYAPSASHLPAKGLGGLGHNTTSAYLIPNAGWSQFRTMSLPILTREFFHAWNEERIHSSQMASIDYTAPVQTTSLWFTDGVTDYYAHLLPARFGAVPASNFYNDIQLWYDALHAQGDASGSLEDLSKNASEEDPEHSRYFLAKAPLVALMLDIEIRNKTKNKKSLDDALLQLYKESRNGRTFSDKDLIQTISRITGTDLNYFYTRYIAGTDTLPIEAYLDKMGAVNDMPDALRMTGDLGFDLALTSGGSAIIKNVRDTSSGLAVGDTLERINDITLQGKDLTEVMSHFRDGDKVKLTVVKNKKPQSVGLLASGRLSPSAPKNLKIKVVPAAKPSASQLALRNGIVGKRKVKYASLFKNR